MSQEDRKIRDTRIEMSKYFDCLKHPRMLFPSKNIGINRLQLGMTVRFASSSLINGQMNYLDANHQD